MMKALVTFLSVTALCASASPLMAQEEMPTQVELPNFTEVDANTDGYLSKAELDEAEVSFTIEQVDQNDDDLISRIEYQELVNALQQRQEG